MVMMMLMYLIVTMVMKLLIVPVMLLVDSYGNGDVDEVDCDGGR